MKPKRLMKPWPAFGLNCRQVQIAKPRPHLKFPDHPSKLWPFFRDGSIFTLASHSLDDESQNSRSTRESTKNCTDALQTGMVLKRLSHFIFYFSVFAVNVSVLVNVFTVTHEAALFLLFENAHYFYLFNCKA